MSLNKIQANKVTAIGDRVLVTDMWFGEQKTKSGLIIRSDDGEARGVYPRWGKVYDKGPKNKDAYQIGDWVLVTHGRWTRGITLQDDTVVRMVEAESILAYADEKPDEIQIGREFSDGPATIDPGEFINK
jgi:co-chaperonin GroES (HSP10)